MSNTNGWVKIHRKLLEHYLFEDAQLYKFFSWCVLSAAYEPCMVKFGNKIVELKPGQLVMSLRQTSEKLRVSMRQLRTYIKTLKNDTTIDTQSDTQSTIITIVNWGVYQNSDDFGDTPSDTRSDTRATHARHTPPVTPIIKEYKEDKNNKESKSTQKKSPTPKSEVQKNLYGEEQTVSLSSEQFNRLNQKFGGPALQWMIHKLDIYISTLTGRKRTDYLKRSHYHVLQGWVADEFLKTHKGHVFPRDGTQSGNKPNGRKTTGNSFADYALELEAQEHEGEDVL